jgi:hypothetical protein
MKKKNMGRVLTTKEFIKRSRIKHGNYYSYRSVKCIPNKKIKIICRKHGTFTQFPYNHMRGQGCPTCGRLKTGDSNKKPILKDIFIQKAVKIHGHRYDYSKIDNTVYGTKKVKIICKKHGEFFQVSHKHLRGVGCRKCARELINNSLRKTTIQFIKDAKSKHGNKYDYSKVIYKNNITKVPLICKKHGVFSQRPLMHIRGDGCPKCHYEKLFRILRISKKEFVIRASKLHRNKYRYSKVNYINMEKKVIITCPIHGDFLQSPHVHLARGGCGCPSCNDSKGENKIADFLVRKKINYEREKIFKECKYKKPLRFDFYLPKYHMCIEYDGEQHSEERVWPSKEAYKNSKERDRIKNEYCNKNGIILIRVPYTAFKYTDLILEKRILA